MSDNRSFYLTGIRFKIAAENKSYVHVVENNHSIFDDIEAQLTVRVKVKMLWENLKSGKLPNLFLRWSIRNFLTHSLHLLDIWKSEKFVFGIGLC